MVANVVVAPEFFVGVIVKRAPADRAAKVIVFVGVIHDAEMTEGVLQPAVRRIEGFGREHVAVVLGDELWQANCAFPRGRLIEAMLQRGAGEIVIGVDVVVAFRFFEVADAKALSGWVELFLDLVGALIEFFVVLALVDAEAIGDQRRMVPFLQDESLGQIEEVIAPFLVFADVLPARDFVDDEKAEFVAFVQEGFVIAIMRGADDVAAKLFLKNPSVFPLRARRQGSADISKSLVAVQATEFEGFAIEIEAIFLPFDVAETNQEFAGFLADRDKKAVELWLVACVPRGDGRRNLMIVRIEVLDEMISVIKRVMWLFFADDLRLEAKGAIGVRFDQDVFEIALGVRLDIDRAVNAAEGQIVDDFAKRRDVRVFAGIQDDQEAVLFLLETFAYVEFDGHEARNVLAQILAIEIDVDLKHRAFKDQEIDGEIVLHVEKLLVAIKALVGGLGEVIQRDFFDGVGKVDFTRADRELFEI